MRAVVAIYANEFSFISALSSFFSNEVYKHLRSTNATFEQISRIHILQKHEYSFYFIFIVMSLYREMYVIY